MKGAAQTIQAIAELVDGELVGPADVLVHGVEALDRADDTHLTFIGDQKYAHRWGGSSAGAALIARGLTADSADDNRPLVYVDNADLAMARVLELFAPAAPQPASGIHDSAVVDPSATIGADARIGAHCYVGPNVTLGDRCTLHAGVTILDGAQLGADCELWPGAVVRERCVLGERCICQPNVTLGADGFGYRPAADGKGLVKIPHIGTVELGNDVEIGAGTCIDRGKFAATVIGDGTKIDNLVQIGHNCRIGRAVVVAGRSGIGGSVTIGDGVMVGGSVAIKDHLTVGAGAQLAGGTKLMNDVPAGATWAGVPAQPMRDALTRNALLRKLPDLVKQIKQLQRDAERTADE